MLKNDNPLEMQDQPDNNADETKKNTTERTDNSADSVEQKQEAKVENESKEVSEDVDSLSYDNEGNTTELETDPKDMMIKELEDKNKELNDKYLRLFSEFDNFRKRTIKERIELTKTASAEMTEAILPVLDDLERAHKAALNNPDVEALTGGVNLIINKLKTTLKHKGLEEIPTIGEVFNTDFHEAITNIPAQDEKDKGKIIEEVQKGYLLNGKIIRFAKVVVAN